MTGRKLNALLAWKRRESEERFVADDLLGFRRQRENAGGHVARRKRREEMQISNADEQRLQRLHQLPSPPPPVPSPPRATTPTSHRCWQSPSPRPTNSCGEKVQIHTKIRKSPDISRRSDSKECSSEYVLGRRDQLSEKLLRRRIANDSQRRIRRQIERKEPSRNSSP